MRPLACLIPLLFFPFSAYSQHDTDINIQKLIENIFSVQDADLNYEELYESLLLYYSNPIPINKATKDELRSLFILSDAQINSLLAYREKYGNLLSIYELQAIPLFDMTTIRDLIPFITVRHTGLNANNRPLLTRILNEPNNYLLLRYNRTLEQKKGYTKGEPGDSRYAGSPDKLSLRFRLSHTRDFSLGFAAEKDAGEPLTTDKTRGADSYGFHFQLQNHGKLKNLVLGDYKIQFGQSLLFAAGFSVGKGAETITTTRRSNLGIRPYTSIVETNFFRGAAATIELNKALDVTTFYSRLAQDATIEADNTIAAIKSTGLHRTANELAAKNQVTQQSFGGNILYHNSPNNLQLGLSFLSDHFSSPIKRSDKPYKRFDFHGSANFNVGLSLNYNWQNVTSFGELARSASGGVGAIAGLMVSLTRQLETAIVVRNYDRNFHSFHGGAFGESGRNSNEKGLYWGFKYTPSRKYQFTAYFDRFMFPWLKFGVDAPSQGNEFLVRANYRKSRATTAYVQFRQESKAENPSAEDVLYPVRSPVNGIKRNYIINLSHTLDKTISLKSRVQFSSYNFRAKTTTGYAIIQDLNVDFRKFRVSTRFAIFDTDDYENRQYAYERDVLYGFSIPPYSGRGTRKYILFQYKLNRKIDLWLRYARTHYRDRDKVSSGLEEIDGNIKTDVKAQVRIQF